MNGNLVKVENENGEFFVNRFQVLTTPIVVYEVWERTNGIAGNHSTITRFDGEVDGWFGELTSRRADGLAINDLPAGSDERIAAFCEWRGGLVRMAWNAIETAFPHLDGSPNEVRFCDNGDVEEIFQNVEAATSSIMRGRSGNL